MAGKERARKRGAEGKACSTNLVFLLSLAAFPANSSTSAAKYSITAAK